MSTENPIRDPAEEYEALERQALYALTESDRCPTIYSVADLGRELGTYDPVAVIEPLCRAGLLHRLAGDFVTATPAAFKWVELVGHVI